MHLVSMTNDFKQLKKIAWLKKLSIQSSYSFPTAVHIPGGGTPILTGVGCLSAYLLGFKILGFGTA